MPTIEVARNAMATRFEFVLHGHNTVALRAAAEEALDEIQRLENLLSLYRPTSDISRINAHAAHQPVRIDPEVFALLKTALYLSELTSGAFDITVAPLIRCWGFMGGSGQMPAHHQIAEAMQKIGRHHVHLQENDFSVAFDRNGVMLDLGAIGKGYALERAVDILINDDVQNALLHGGTSTICALGKPENADTWKVSIDYPPPETQPRPTPTSPQTQIPPPPALAVLPLHNESLSVSATWGKSFQADGKTYGHVLDPRTGAPAQGALLAAIAGPSPTETDALSTALLTLGLLGLQTISQLRPNFRSLVVAPTSQPDQYQIQTHGIEILTKPHASER